MEDVFPLNLGTLGVLQSGIWIGTAWAMCGHGFMGGLQGWLVTGVGDGEFKKTVVVVRVNVVNPEESRVVTTTIRGTLRSKR